MIPINTPAHPTVPIDLSTQLMQRFKFEIHGGTETVARDLGRYSKHVILFVSCMKAVIVIVAVPVIQFVGIFGSASIISVRSRMCLAPWQLSRALWPRRGKLTEATLPKVISARREESKFSSNEEKDADDT